MEVWGNKTQSYDRVVTWHGSLTPEAVKQIRRCVGHDTFRNTTLL